MDSNDSQRATICGRPFFFAARATDWKGRFRGNQISRAMLAASMR
jgi:hypothetical protein